MDRPSKKRAGAVAGSPSAKRPKFSVSRPIVSFANVKHMGCRVVHTSVSIAHVTDTNLDTLSNLQRIEGALYINNNAYLNNVDGLRRLERVAGHRPS